MQAPSPSSYQSPTFSPPPPPESTSPPLTFSPPPPPESTSPPLTFSPPPSPESTSPSPSSPPAPPPINPTASWPPPSSSTAASPGGGMSSGALAGLLSGILIGGVMVLVGVGFFVFFYRRKKRKEGANSNFTPDPPQGPKDEPSYGPPQHWNQNAPPPPDYKVTILPKPASPPGISSNPHRSPVHEPTFPEPPSTSSCLGSEKQPHQSLLAGMALGFSQNTFTYEELAMATDGFSDANFIGQGGFGYVHKGVLPNGKPVAIKQLKAGSSQGEREFQAEVEIINRVHHRHLVSLVGYCMTGAQRMLVYEFVPNNTLEFHLHEKGRPVMDWPIRMKIALGSAKGLAYLHEDCHPKIIHRDIKASNILIDHSFEPKVADFGLAKSTLDSDTHVSTRVMGTFGYLAPEYASSGKLTDKSDVFSFGVVLLELITGRRPIDKTQSFVDDSMVDWAKPLLTRALEDGNFDPLVDPRLRKDYDPNEMTRVVTCAAACVRHSARRRPRMSQIVRALEGNMALDDLNDGVTTGQSTVLSTYGSSSDYNSTQYREDLQKFRKRALETQEHGSSEYSPPTSECGQNQSSSSTEGQQTTQEMESQKMEKDTKKHL